MTIPKRLPCTLRLSFLVYASSAISIFFVTTPTTSVEADEIVASRSQETGHAEAISTKSPNAYVRLLRENGPAADDGDPIALQTSICRFQSPDGKQRVDLIGAIHIGERSYYRKLNQRFQKYDALLYELVAPEGTRIPKGGAEPGSAVGYLQSGMTQMLELTYQLKEVDYTPHNFVHADMTPEEFSASMKKRKESVSRMFFRALGQSLVQQSRQGKLGQEAEVLAAMVSDNRTHALRVALAKQFADLDGSTLVFGGKDGSTLITERNKKALRILQSQLNAGKTNIGVFYGAGHLQDMAKRLIDDFGMQPAGSSWLTAWDLHPQEAP